MQSKNVIKRAGDGHWLDVLGMKVKFLCDAEDTNGQYSNMLNTVPTDKGAPPHKHPWDEAFYVLKGDIEFQVADERHRLSAGDYVLIPADHVHSFRGLSEEEGLILGFEVPSNSQKFFQEINDTVTDLPGDLGKMPDIGKRHQVTLL